MNELNNLMLEAALSYVRKGVSVFPCQARGKEPLIKGWQNKATTDENQIRAWWDKWPDANIGLPTGKVNGFWALDIDSESALEEAGRRGYLPTTALYDDEGKRGTILDACIVKTGKGWQVYFEYPEGVDELRGSVGKIGEGLDVRADGNYVVAPGSVHPNGARYEYASAVKSLRRLLRAF